MMKIRTIRLEDRIYPLGFKVVTQDMKSLGLRRNPHILSYPVGEWLYLSPEQTLAGKDDYGGIWVARTLPDARRLSRYMQERYSRPTRVFQAALDRILYCNGYRIKTNGVLLLEEMKAV